MLILCTAFYAVHNRKGTFMRISHMLSRRRLAKQWKPGSLQQHSYTVFYSISQKSSTWPLMCLYCCQEALQWLWSLFSFFSPLPVFKSETAPKQNDKLGPAAFPSAALDVSVAVDHHGGWRGFAQHLADGEVDGCMWSSMKWPFWCTHFKHT